MSNKIYYDPFTQYENTGDLLINLSLLSNLKGYGEIIVDDKNKPEWFLQNLLQNEEIRFSTYSQRDIVSYLLRTLPRRVFSSRKEKVYLLLVPGDTSRKGRKKAISKFKELSKFAVLKFFGCRIVRLGFSIGPFDRLNLLAEKLSSHIYHAYGLRDTKSLALAKKNNFKHLFFAPDFAWSYRLNLSNRRSEGASSYIVLSFRSNAYGTLHDKAFLEPVLKNLNAILSLDYFKAFQVKVVYQVQFDRDASTQIYEYLKDKCDIEFIDRKLLLDDCLTLYNGARLIISNRLHVLLSAALTGTLSLPLINAQQNKKIVSIYEDNNLSSLLLDYLEDTEVNIKKVSEAIEHEKIWNEKLSKVTDTNRVKTEKVIKEVFK